MLKKGQTYIKGGSKKLHPLDSSIQWTSDKLKERDRMIYYYTSKKFIWTTFCQKKVKILNIKTSQLSESDIPIKSAQ